MYVLLQTRDAWYNLVFLYIRSHDLLKNNFHGKVICRVRLGQWHIYLKAIK